MLWLRLTPASRCTHHRPPCNPKHQPAPQQLTAPGASRPPAFLGEEALGRPPTSMHRHTHSLSTHSPPPLASAPPKKPKREQKGTKHTHPKQRTRRSTLPVLLFSRLALASLPSSLSCPSLHYEPHPTITSRPPISLVASISPLADSSSSLSSSSSHEPVRATFVLFFPPSFQYFVRDRLSMIRRLSVEISQLTTLTISLAQITFRYPA